MEEEGGRKRGIRGEGTSSGLFGTSVRWRGGRRDVGPSSWMGGVRAPVGFLICSAPRLRTGANENVGGDSVMGLCQAAVAEAVEAFGKLDILLCCSSEGLHLQDCLSGVNEC